MFRSSLAAFAAVSLLAASPDLARAQAVPADPPLGPPVAAPEEPRGPSAPAPEQPATPAPPPSADEVALDAVYDAAFEAFVNGDYDAAIRGFAEVAAGTTDPGRRTAAIELGRLAARMKLGKRAGLVDDNGRLELDSGRPSFVVASTLSSFYAGLVLLDTFNVDDYRPSVAIVTLTTAAGFVGSLFATRDAKVSEGMAAAYYTGLWTGLANGLLIGPALGFGPDPDGTGDGEVAQGYLTFGLVTMAVGGAAGAYLGHKREPTTAQVRAAGLLGINTFLTTAIGLIVFEADFDDDDNYPLVLGLGLDVGLGLGIFAAKDMDWSGSRVTYVGLGEFLGALAGFASSALVIGADPSDGQAKTMAIMTLAGLWGGGGLAVHLTRDLPKHPRYRPRPAALSSWQLAPVALGGGGTGLGVVGAF
jgi:hypothetical protein